MENENKRIVEINGVKIEVDLRTAKRVDSFKVGDKVKVLVKEYSDYVPHAGVIVGFDEFNKLPTIVVAYLKDSYSSVEMNFAYINEKSEDTEIVSASDYDFNISKNKALDCFDGKINKAVKEVDELTQQKAWFEKNYNTYFKAYEL